jgi:streptogramin lyase
MRTSIKYSTLASVLGVALVASACQEQAANNAPAMMEHAQAQADSPIISQAEVESAALTGIVSSVEEGVMGGVLVSAKLDGATTKTTVVTDPMGRYAFPADRIEPGNYRIEIRAIGYNLRGPRNVEVTGSSATNVDIALRPTGNIAAQLTNGEWMMSIPGGDNQKAFLGGCMNCHELNVITNSVHDKERFAELIPEMGRYYPGSRPGRKQILPLGPRGNRGIQDERIIDMASTYLASVNMEPDGTFDYELQTHPRPSGRGTQMIVTTYDLPRPEALPHDAIMVKGKVYYSDFGSLVMGELDPETGIVTDYDIPLLKPSAPQGTLGLQPDNDGNVWLALMYQGGLAKFDTTTKEITTYPIPAEWQNASTQESMVSPRNWHVDGYVWTNDQSDHSFLRLDVATGEYEKLPPLVDQNGDRIRGYELPSDSDNNLWALEFGGAGTKIGRVDRETRELRTWPSPMGRARARRGQFAQDGTLWFAEFGSNSIGNFDPVNERFLEWEVPTPYTMPYDAIKSELTGEVWTASMSTDRVTRFNPETTEFVEYLLPDYTNIRRVFVDDSTGDFWVGANHRPALIRLEPLD